MSGIVNKIKEAVHHDKSATNTHHTTGTHAEGATGPHNSRLANAADPRVDSDRDGSSTMGGATRTAGHNEFGQSNPLSGSGTTGYGSGTAEGTHGPHSSRLANVADPRVDSDRDGSSTIGGGAGRTAGMTGSHGLGTSGNTGAFGSTTHGTAEGVHGPHSSRLANAADPRVDSDRDGSSTMGGAGRTAGMTGSHGLGTSDNTGAFGSSNRGTAEGVHGPHSSRLANAADPRVDSDRDGSSTLGNTGRTAGHSTGHSTGTYGSGPGPAANTAGPHSSDMMNKLDPRVDSDLDGSKTMGGNKTYQSGNSNALHHRDPTDAAQVPPSVLQRHIGDPIVEHNDHQHQRQRRNSVKTSQETFSGI